MKKLLICNAEDMNMYYINYMHKEPWFHTTHECIG